MAPIGPQLPAYSLTRARTPDSDDDIRNYDTVAPRGFSSAAVEIGPSILPLGVGPRLAQRPVDEDEDEDEDDAFGPALPPELLASRNMPVAKEKQPEPNPKRVQGPSMPGHDRQSDDDDDESDDDYGPMPIPAGASGADSVSEGVREFLEKEEKRRKEVEEAAKPKQLKRDEWMLVPPSSSDLLGHLSDPTKLKARQFSRGGSTATRGAPNNLWTETPAERQQRVADEVAGKKRRAANAEEEPSTVADERKKRKHEEDIRRAVDAHNKSSRAQSLLDLHATKSKSDKKDKDEEPAAIWDHSRDMALGGRLMDEKQRSKLISDARSLGDRFGSGKGGGYL